MKIFSPDGTLCLDVALARGDAGRATCVFRALLGRGAALARSEIAAPASNGPTGEVETRELVGRGGVVLAREMTVRFRRGRCIFRVADDALAVVAEGGGLVPVPRFPSTLSRGYTPTVAKDGRAGYEVCGPAACRAVADHLRGLLFYSNGLCAAVAAAGEAGVFAMTVADRPAAAILPRGMRHLLLGLPRGVARRVAAQDVAPVAFPPCGDAEFNVNAVFLGFGYIFDACRAAGTPIDRALTSFYHLDPRIPACLPDSGRAVTPAHAEAFAILTDPARGEAAAGFRGEMGEYVCGARRVGGAWLVAGITAKLRVLTLFFPYLEEGVRYRASWTLDDGATLPTNAVNPTPSTVAAGDKAMVRMNPDGGFVLRLEPED